MEIQGTQRAVYTVSEISRRVKDLVERHFTDIWIEGEISNLRRTARGHIYFTLKDNHSQLPAVCFRSAAVYLRFTPRNGECFRVRGRLSTYEARGEYQIIVEVLEPAGRGALQEAFERLKEKLDREGLFDPARKRPLPPYPSRIGIITSPGSAALRDILTVLERRHDAVDVQIYPTEVQGPAAAAQIAEGIDRLGRSEVDVVIVTRGGGSIEDLWPFNDERVARAIYRSEKPVISAVGHEIDFTISDFVADLRAPTPSAAAEMVARSKRETLDRLEVIEGRMKAALRHRLSELRRFLADRVGGRGFRMAERRIRGMVQRLDDCSFRLEQIAKLQRLSVSRAARLERADRAARAAVERVLFRNRERFGALTHALDALSPLGVLERGYAVCRNARGTVLRSASEVEVGSPVEVLLYEGSLFARVTAVEKSRRRQDE